MPLPFSGAAIPLKTTDITAAAARLGCLPEAVEAVMTVETGGAGGFLADGSGRPRILCEAKIFGDLTGHRYDATHPLISCGVANWKLYRGGAAEYDRLSQMSALDPVAAIKATSWGLFQIMGMSFETLGYASPDAMVKGVASSEGQQLEDFVTFCEANHLAPYLRNTNWSAFAEHYNGPDYSVNRYDIKLATAFLAARGHLSPTLQIGTRGNDVADLQRALAKAGEPLVPDGVFGVATELAVKRFQSMRGLPVDGVVGPGTLTALGLTAGLAAR